MANPRIIYLKDYQAAPYQIKHVDLDFNLFADFTDVNAKSVFTSTGGTSNPLVLNGQNLELLQILIDGRELNTAEYSVDEEYLTIHSPPANFTLEIYNRIRPHLNTCLEGLYKSQGMYCTQCEATGFRRITYFYDRPDVMSTYRVTIRADKEKYPVLLSNGNFIDQGDLPKKRHWATWEDPFPKPCYLFALVAGDLAKMEDSFKTRSGKTVKLAIYADEKDISKCDHAMTSLKNAMRWDEDTYGLECDLDFYNIVAVRDFNMGAMENKGLNIFNSSRVLARPETTTDESFLDVTAVIGHEYFHNWTGNRVTCRDWFQLCLKEGLTVFRDQEFSQAMGSLAVKRIDDLQRLRQLQFPDDDGPTAHPPRPDHFIEINNFYTTTIYEKGAELVRLLKTLIGTEKFRHGMDLYFARHDGKAVTQEDFVQAMADASGKDLSQFMLWYTQAGAPHINFNAHYDEQKQIYMLNIEQKTLPTPGQDEKKPLHIPIRVSLLDANSGEPIQIYREHNPEPQGHECVIELTKEKQSFMFHKVKHKPTVSLFRGAAPVRIDYENSDEELIFLMKHDTDPVNAWDAGQKLLIRQSLNLVKSIQQKQEPKIDPNVAEAFGFFLHKDIRDKAFKAAVLTIPSLDLIAQFMSTIDPEILWSARNVLKQSLASMFREPLLECYHTNHSKKPFALDPETMGRKRLKNVCLSYLASQQDNGALELILAQYYEANNMSDRLAALNELANWDTPKRSPILEHFYQAWQHEELVIDHWFSIQARSSLPQTLDRVLDLMKHPAFDTLNPNRLRSLVMAFCKSNPLHFHQKNGRAYSFCREQVIAIDALNRQMAASLVRAFSQWRRFDQSRQGKMQAELLTIKKQKGLSPDVYELVTKIL